MISSKLPAFVGVSLRAYLGGIAPGPPLEVKKIHTSIECENKFHANI